MSVERQRRPLRLQAVAVIGLAGFVFYRATRMSNFGTDPGSPGVFPALVALVLLLCALLIWREASTAPEAAPAVVGEAIRPTALIAAAMAVLYGAALKSLGFVGASVVYLTVTFLWLRVAPWWRAALMAIGAVGITYLVFKKVFLVILP